MVSRRGFLKILGGVAAATVVAPILSTATPALAKPSAPLFVPSNRLEMGVPRTILTATEMPKAPVASTLEVLDAGVASRRMRRSVPAMLLQDNYIQEYGGRLKAGSTLLVDPETATRWFRRGIAVAPDGSTVQRIIPGRDHRSLAQRYGGPPPSRRVF